MPEPSGQERVVYVIDDDRLVRTTISQMIAAIDDPPGPYTSYPFGSAADFLDSAGSLRPGVVLLDLRMPGVDGFEVMARLRERDIDWPIVVMTGASEVPIAVQAMKMGAVEFIEKPVRLDPLIETLRNAAPLLDERLASGDRRRGARAKIDQLSQREFEVLSGLIEGCSNKELANQLGIGLRTVEMHRGNMMDRLGASSLAQVVALAIEAGLQPGVDHRAA